MQKIGGDFLASNVILYSWNGVGWNPETTLQAIGGTVYYTTTTSTTKYVEIKVPNTAIGMDPVSGSYAIALLSLPPAPGTIPLDSTPTDPAIPGGSLVSRFASVSERMMMVMPLSNIENDPRTFSSVPPVFWEYPTGSNGTAPGQAVPMRSISILNSQDRSLGSMI